MKDQVIKFEALNQSLRKTSGFSTYPNGMVEIITAEFELGDEWDGYDSVRAVWQNGEVKISSFLDSNYKCKIPSEVLENKGTLEVNLVASSVDDDVLTERLTSYKVVAFQIPVKVNIDGSDPQDVTPSQFEQFVAVVKGDADRAEAGATDAEASAQSASGSATASANSATASATSADESEQSKTQAQEYAQNAYNSAVGAESAKDDAEDARDEIRSTRAEAVTLSPGSDATASYSDGLLSLGIPRGDKGETGATGATGPKGDTGERGPKGDKGDPGEVTQAEFDALAEEVASVIKNSASGAIASFPDGAARPVDDLTVQIEPVQDLHGYEHPWPAGGGKNLFYHEGDVTASNNGVTATFNGNTQSITISGTNTGTSAYVLLIIPITSDVPRDTPLCRALINVPSGVYLNFVYRKNSLWYEVNNGRVVPEDVDADAPISMQIGILGTTTTISQTVMYIELEKGSTALTEWTPYSNICPITGWTGAKVTRTGKNLADFVDGYGVDVNGFVTPIVNRTSTIMPIRIKSGYKYRYSTNSAAACIYAVWKGDELVRRIASIPSGSILNVDGGDMLYATAYGASDDNVTKDAYHPMLTLEDDNYADYEPYSGSTYDIAFPTEAGTVYGGTLDVTNGVLTVDRAQIASYAGETLPSTWISDRDVYSAGATPTTGAQVVYELATPITYHLTPQEITTLLGQNNIWADTGDTSVAYKADTKLYIDKKFTELQALILEN